MSEHSGPVTYFGTVMHGGLVRHAQKTGRHVLWKDDLGRWRAAGGKVRSTFIALDGEGHRERVELLVVQHEQHVERYLYPEPTNDDEGTRG